MQNTMNAEINSNQLITVLQRILCGARSVIRTMIEINLLTVLLLYQFQIFSGHQFYNSHIL